MTDVQVTISALPVTTRETLPPDPVNTWFVILDSSKMKTNKINLGELVAFINDYNKKATYVNMSIGTGSGITISDGTKTVSASSSLNLISLNLGSTYTISDKVTYDLADNANNNAIIAISDAAKAKKDAAIALANAKIALVNADKAQQKADEAYDLIETHITEPYSGSEHQVVNYTTNGFMSKDDKINLDNLWTNRIGKLTVGDGLDIDEITTPKGYKITANLASTTANGIVKLSDDFNTNNELAATTSAVYDAFFKAQNQNYTNFPFFTALPIDFSQEYGTDSSITTYYNNNPPKDAKPVDLDQTTRGHFSIGDLSVEWGSQYITGDITTIMLKKRITPTGLFTTVGNGFKSENRIKAPFHVTFGNIGGGEYYSTTKYPKIANKISIYRDTGDEGNFRIYWMVIGKFVDYGSEKIDNVFDNFDSALYPYHTPITTFTVEGTIKTLPTKSTTSIPDANKTNGVVVVNQFKIVDAGLLDNPIKFKFPPKTTKATVYLQGAGGGGSAGSPTIAGNGGGGGGYLKTNIDVIKDAEYSLTIGTGGLGSTESGKNGSNGTYTELRVTDSNDKTYVLKAQGGRGGIFGDTNPYNCGGFYMDGFSATNTFGSKGYSGLVGDNNIGGAGGIGGIKENINKTGIVERLANSGVILIDFNNMHGGTGGNEDVAKVPLKPAPSPANFGSYGCGGGGGGKNTFLHGARGGNGYAILEFVSYETVSVIGV